MPIAITHSSLTCNVPFMRRGSIAASLVGNTVACALLLSARQHFITVCLAAEHRDLVVARIVSEAEEQIRMGGVRRLQPERVVNPSWRLTASDCHLCSICCEQGC
jgi:hypothetical protein